MNGVRVCVDKSEIVERSFVRRVTSLEPQRIN
jgi:hypothetical protein